MGSGRMLYRLRFEGPEGIDNKVWGLRSKV